MKLIDIIKTANSNLFRNKGRTFLTILAIFIGSFTIILTTGIRTGVNGYIDAQMNSAGGENLIEVTTAAMGETSDGMMGGSSGPKKYEPKSDTVSDPTAALSKYTISDEQLDKIRQIKNIESAQPFLMTRMTSMMSGASVEYITGKNGEKYEFNVRTALDSVNLDTKVGQKLNNQTKENQVAVGMEYVSALGYKDDRDALGSEVTLYIPDRGAGKLVAVKAKIAAILNKSILTMGGGAANSRLVDTIIETSEQNLPPMMKNLHMFVAAEMKSGLSDAETSKIKDELKGLGLHGMTAEEEVGMIKSFFDAIILVFTIFGGIALLAASIGIINTLFMAVQERTREIGLMKAMGLGKGKIFLTFSIEAISLGFWGSAIGVGVAYLAKTIVNPLAADTFLKDLPGFNLMEFDVWMLAMLVALVMAIAFLAGTLPARRAAKKDPIEALRYE